MKDIKDILPTKLRKGDFTFNTPQNLFEPFWENLKDIRCPFCSYKLKATKDRELFVCSRKKYHKRAFAIGREKLITHVVK